MNKNILKVSCAIIEENGKILVAQRSEKMNLPLKWEFPGGKIRVNERGEDGISREIREELGLQIQVYGSLNPSIFVEENRVIVLFPYICKIIGGKLDISEHKMILWDYPENFLNIDWAPADIPVLNEYLQAKSSKSLNKEDGK